MSFGPQVSVLERFRRHVGMRLGLLLEGSLEDTLEQALHQRTSVHGLDSEGDYLSRLEAGLLGRSEEQELATLLTIGETHFFRNPEHFAAFSERVIPQWLERRRGSAPLRILSAGCATGEEPYTLAMVVARRWPELLPTVEIVGFDLDAKALERARQGEYSRWSLRAIPDGYRKRYFEAHGDRFLLSPQIRSMVRFEERNLVHENADLLAPRRFDVIFCRNVVIYFRFAVTRDLVQRFSRALAPTGFLFLGHTESLRGVSKDFSVEHTHGTFYYRRLATPAAPTVSPPSLSPWRAGFHSTALETVGSPRARDLPSHAAGAETAVETGAKGASDTEVPNRGRILELLRLERFEEALPLAEALVREEARDVDSLTLLAVLLTNRGDVERARAACQTILGLDSLHAGAHYLFALCAELEGLGDEAQGHDETAVHLDPTFSMAHLHLGRLALREERLDVAAIHLERAESLLETTESSQLLLYGGGFRREALIALCRAQLAGLEPSSS